MLIARAPVRVSLAGGGTDFAAYWQHYGGLVINTTIAKFVYAVVWPSDAPDPQITCSQSGAFVRHPNHGRVDHEGELPRAVLAHFGLTRGVNLHIASDVPPGTGLGSSSATTVALVQALAALLHKPYTKREVAEETCAIEIEELQLPMGQQDQYAAAFGGLNAIAFGSEGTRVQPLRVAPQVRAALEAHLMLFFSGMSRNSRQILSRQQEGMQSGGATVESLHHIHRLALKVKEALEGGAPDRLGELLHENWMHKRHLAAGISNSHIDEAYAEARAQGAVGGKITGAGGGGFLMLYCPTSSQAAVSAALSARGFERMDFHFESEGVQVVFDSEATADGNTALDLPAEVAAIVRQSAVDHGLLTRAMGRRVGS